jgi:hypothetical protein
MMLSTQYKEMDLHKEVELRRARIDLYSPAEAAIRNALIEVEKIGADVELTGVVVELDRSLRRLQNFLLDK